MPSGSIVKPSKRASVVGDLMSTPAVTVSPSERVVTAGLRMVERQVGSVVVVDAQHPVGILTERDLVRLASAGGAPSDAIVADWMTAAPDIAGPDTGIDEALRHLTEHGYRHLPVIDNGMLVGVVSLRDLMRVAQIRPAGETAIDVPRGLKGVVVTETELGDVRGTEGFYHYRQYSAVELVQKRTLEDVWFLLFDDHLPDDAERKRFLAETAALRSIPDAARPAIREAAAAGDTSQPLASLRTAISAVAAAIGLRPSYDLDHAQLRTDGLMISAVTPTLVAALHRLGQGQEPIEPRPDLTHAANYLWMVTGSEPDPDLARAIEQYLMLTVDHGFNASTFTARVITSTGADLGAAVTGAIGALSGPLHGGAPSRALETLEAIGTPDHAAEWVRNAVARGERIMGFGHAVYRTDDPRSLLLRDVASRLGGELAEFAMTVEQLIVETLAELKPGRELYANVEYYAGVVMTQCGLPRELFTPTFTVSRTIGWCANVLEQAADNRIIRPSARYVGPPPPEPVPDP